MTASIDNRHFRELAEKDPRDVCQRAQCQYDDQHQRYLLTVWGDVYAITPDRAAIEPLAADAPPLHDYLYLFMVHYLLHAKAADPSGVWISEKDIPGGAAFFRGPHEIPTHLIASGEGGRIAFETHCRQWHGQPLQMADAAYRFLIAPRIPVAVLYWDGDDDFAAEAKIHYDRTVAAHLALDVIYALATGVCHRWGQP